MQKIRRNIKKYISFFLAFGLFIGSFNISNAMDDTVITSDEVISEEEVLIKENNESKPNEEVVTSENNIETDETLNNETFVSDSIEEEVLKELEEKEIISNEQVNEESIEEINEESNLEETDLEINEDISNKDEINTDNKEEIVNEEITSSKTDNIDNQEQNSKLETNEIKDDMDSVSDNDLEEINTNEIDSNTLLEEIPPEVKDFIYKINQLPNINSITNENVEEIGNQINEILDLYEKLITLGYSEREDIINVINIFYEVCTKIDDILNSKADLYLATIPNYTPTDRYYYKGKEVCQLYEGTYPVNTVEKYNNQQLDLEMKVGEESNQQFLYTKKAICPRCTNLLVEVTPDWIAVDANRKLTNSNPEMIDNISFKLSGYIPKDTNNEDYYNYPSLDFIIKGKKPGNALIEFYCYQNYYYYYTWVNCRRCGQHFPEVSFKSKWIEDKHDINVTIYADYILNYNTNGGSDIDSQNITKASDTVSIPTTKTIPQKQGYEFLYWEDEEYNIYKPILENGNIIKWVNEDNQEIDENIKINWKEGFGSEDNPVTKTLTAVWKEITEETYTVIYKDGVDGLAFGTYRYGNLKENDKTPEFQGTLTLNGYTFMEWTPLINPIVSASDANANNEIIYTATWMKEIEKILKVSWYDEDKNTKLDTNTFKQTEQEPSYSKELPTKEADENYTYKFLQWVKQETPLNDDDISYVAEYEKIPIKYGSYQVKHEYYAKDKNNNLNLENTVSENIVSNVIVGTIIEVNNINQIPENNGKIYTFFEHTGNITIEENITKEITIKYVRDKEYGSYKVKHEYYTKDKDGNMSLDKTNTEEAVLLETGTVLDTSTIELKPEQYTYSEISDKTVTIETDVEKIITIKYVKEEKCGSYQIKHEYYVKDKENNLTLENTVSENIVSNVIVGTIIEADKLNQIPENNGKSYTFLEHTGNIIIEENVTKEITIKYVRNKEYGSYKVKHNYYVKDKNGNFILEETVLEDSVLVEPNVSIGLKDADIIIFQKLRDGYKFKDSSERMTIQANKEIEFVINYFREDSVIIEYGNYQVIHQYYLDDKLESTITEDTVSNIKVGTSIGVVDADILVSKKLNHNNKNYEFVSANKVVIESNKTATLIIKYVRKTEPTIPEEVKPVSVSITAKKKLENGSLKDKQFSFRLTNGVVTYIAENDSYGNINFNPLTFDTEGTYKFTLSEDNTNESNIKYDSSKYEVEIVVSKVGNSLTASVKYFKDGKEFSEINFINKYEIPKEEKPTETPNVDNKPTNNNPNDKPNTSTSDLIEISDNEVPQSTPITGDSSHILLFMFLFIVSGFCLIILKKRKS